MHRRRLLAAIGAVATTGITGCGGDGTETTGTPTETDSPPTGGTPTSRPTTATETPTATATPPPTMDNGSFEDGLAGWTVGRDLPMDPNAGDERQVDSEVSVTDERASDGERSCALSIDGRQDDGTLWVQQEAGLAAVDGLAVDLYTEQESFNTITKVAVYTGPVPEFELAEGDFDTSRPVEDHEGWKTYEYDVDHDGPGLVAVGISVVWEIELTRFLDTVRLR